MNQIDRLQCGVYPSGRTYITLRYGDRVTVLSDLPHSEQVRLLKEWAEDVAAERSMMAAKP